MTIATLAEEKGERSLPPTLAQLYQARPELHQLPRCAVTGKLTHATEDQARSACLEGQTTHFCFYCEGWHVTSSPSGPRKRPRRREYLERRWNL